MTTFQNTVISWLWWSIITAQRKMYLNIPPCMRVWFVSSLKFDEKIYTHAFVECHTKNFYCNTIANWVSWNDAERH